MKKGIFIKLIITFVIIANIIFTLAVLFIFLKNNSEPSALIDAWFSFTTVEVCSLASIKKAKEKEENRR